MPLPKHLLKQLPITSLPRPGERIVLPPLAGAADALALAGISSDGPMRVVMTASPGDAQRLLEEIPWFAPQARVRLLPDWETLPYDSFSPHHDLVSERLATLYTVMRGDCDILLLPASTALYRMAPPAWLAARTFFIKQGERLDAHKMKAQMATAGYAHVTQVVSPGEYSVRGGLIDLFPMGSPLPYRLDLFGDEVESIKTFDVDSQRTLYPVPEIRLLPAREFPLDDAGRTRFRQRFREVFEGDPAKSGIYRDISAGTPSAGIEYWLPLFFEETATLFDYLPEDVVLCLHGDVHAAIRAFWLDTDSRHRMLDGDRTRPLLPPGELFLSEEQFFVAAKPHARIDMPGSTGTTELAAGPTQALPPVAVDRRADDPLKALKAFLEHYPGRVFLLAESAGRRETLTELLAEYGLKPEAVADPLAFVTEGTKLDLRDWRPDLGALGKLHVRFGKGSRGRGSKQRLVPAINGADKLIDWWLGDVRHRFGPDWDDPDAPMIPSERFDHELGRSWRASDDVLRRGLARATERFLPAWAGGRMTPHVLRHYCASSLYLAGMDLKALQELLGHQWLATTTQYIHVPGEHVEDSWMQANQRLEDRFEGMTTR